MWSLLNAEMLSEGMTATCAVLNATICAVLNAAQSSVDKPAIVAVERPAMIAVERLGTMEAMGDSFSVFDSSNRRRGEPLDLH
jgi:hypothetical protein